MFWGRKEETRDLKETILKTFANFASSFYKKAKNINFFFDTFTSAKFSILGFYQI